MDTHNSTIVFFDSHCLLCNGSVRFILKHEKLHILFFAPFGGITYQKIVGSSIEGQIPDTIVVTYQNKVFRYSKAVILILISMGGFWKILGKFAKIIPTFVLDFFYKIVVRNRYRWFGTTDSCSLPSPETKQRFLD